jgi:F-type H+-transporting ATPase subunit delta
MAHDIFISHSAKDKAIADAVCARLESEGIRCWIAPRDVMPGVEWGRSIVEAIERAKIMILVFSANANTSPQIHREVERAVNHSVVILPFRIENIRPGKSLEYFIGNVHWLDALTPPLEEHIERLVRTVRTLLDQMQPRRKQSASRLSQQAAAAARLEPNVPAPALAPTIAPETSEPVREKQNASGTVAPRRESNPPQVKLEAPAAGVPEADREPTAAAVGATRIETVDAASDAPEEGTHAVIQSRRQSPAFLARYAQAFADVVEDLKLDPAKLDSQFADFLATWEGSLELRSLFQNPTFPATQKVAILDKLNVQLGLQKELRNLIAVLIDNNRIAHVAEVAADWRRILQEQQGIRPAEIITARELSNEERDALAADVAKLAGAKIEATFKLDKGILGGTVVRIGSTVYDGSVRGRLERLRETLTAD